MPKQTKWEDLPKRKNCFTVRNAAMMNLNTGEPIRHYSANTKIQVVQKCNIDGTTYYRTADAAYNFLNHAFEASAFGLPNEKAPLVPSRKHNSKIQNKKSAKTKAQSGSGADKVGKVSIFKKLFGRKNG